MNRRRGGGGNIISRALSRFGGQSEHTEVSKANQVDIPNWSGLWSLIWAFGRWVLLFAVVFPFGLQILWGIFDSCRHWPIVYRLGLYSVWWTMPTWGGVVESWWRFIFLGWGWEGWCIGGAVKQRHVTEIKWPFWSGQPMHRIHNWEIARPGKEPPYRYEDADYADHDVSEQKPPEREITINLKRGKKTQRITLPQTPEFRVFIIAAKNGVKPLTQEGSGYTRKKWEKIRQMCIDAGLVKWKNFLFHTQGLKFTDDAEQIINETFPLP